MKNSRRKGKVGELEWSHYLTEQGFQARRGQQFSGNPEAPDVICTDLPAYHFEVKRVEKLDLPGAMVQALGDCGGKVPIVAHRRNHGPWLVTMLADHWCRLVRERSESPKTTPIEIKL